MRYSYLIIVLFVFLSGCASMKRHVVEVDQSGKTVLLAVLLGDTFVLQKDGITVFEGKEAGVNVSDWSVSKTVSDRLNKDLKEKYVVKAKLLNDKGELSGLKPYYSTTVWKIDDQKAFIRDLAKEHGVDTILLVNKGYYRTVDTYNPASGFGIYQVNALGIKRANLFLTAKVIFYDGATGEEIAWEYAKKNTKLKTWIEIDEKGENDVSNWKDAVVEGSYQMIKALLQEMKVL